jgi:hypothetical protein
MPRRTTLDEIVVAWRDPREVPHRRGRLEYTTPDYDPTTWSPPGGASGGLGWVSRGPPGRLGCPCAA